MQNMPTLDVITPCYNAVDTLQRAVDSVLGQQACHRLILVDDGSTDDTWSLICQLQNANPDKIIALQMPKNSGVATARNWGVLHSKADLVAFLDADDAYQAGALDEVPEIFRHAPTLGVIRLRLIPIDLHERYATHPDFEMVWDIMQMTGAGNTIFNRALFLACGGFPDDALFKRLGGEDGALGVAVSQSALVGTLFEPERAGVLNYCRDGMHAERLLDAYLFNKVASEISDEDRACADAISERIKTQLANMRTVLNASEIGRKPLIITYG